VGTQEEAIALLKKEGVEQHKQRFHVISKGNAFSENDDFSGNVKYALFQNIKCLLKKNYNSSLSEVVIKLTRC